MHDTEAPEERVVLDALLPEGLTVIAILEVELDSVLIEAVALRMQLHQELLATEAELADLCPGEGVDLGVALKDEDAHVGDGQVELHALVVLGRVHHHAVQLHFARDIQQIQVGVGGSLPAVALVVVDDLGRVLVALVREVALVAEVLRVVAVDLLV